MTQSAGIRVARLMVLAVILGCSTVQLEAGDDAKAKVQFTTTSDEARAHIEAGLFDVQNVYQDGAARHFRQAVEADPSYGLAKIFLASVDQSLSPEEQKSLSDEGWAQMADASTEEATYALAVRAADANDFENAHQLYSTLYEMVPGDATVAYFAAFFAGPFQSAQQMAAVADVVARFPDHAAARNQSAYDHWVLGDREGAIEAVTRYVELAPDHPNPHDSYAEMMLNMGMMAKAVEHYRKAVSVDDQHWQGYQGLATALAWHGDTDGAREALTTGAEKAPSANIRYTFHRAKAVTYLIDDNMDGAMNALQDVVDATEGMDGAQQAYTLARYQLAGMSAMNGDRNDAMTHLEAAAVSRPEGWTGYQQFIGALVHLWLEDVDGARSIAAEMEEEDYLISGAIALAEGDHEKAATAIRKTGMNTALERIYMAKCEDAMGNENAVTALISDIHNLDEMDLFSPVDPFAHMIEEELER